MVGSDIQISWLAPNNRGQTISAYIIKISAGDGIAYLTDPSCDGSLASVISDQSCKVPFTVLRNQPFSLAWGTVVKATVIAVNSYDESEESLPGGTAKILRVPDVPINFANVPQITTATQIGLTWQAGPESGGTPVLDYTILYDQGLGASSSFITLIAGR